MRLLIVTALVASAGACVEPLGGSNLQIDFSEGTPAAARPGATPLPNQPPANTHMRMWATDFKYQLDGDGAIVRDPVTGDPVILEAHLFEVFRFELRPVIDITSPCLIDIEPSPYPGVHVTEFANKVRDVTGISDPYAPGQDPGLVQDVLTADRRMELLPLLQGGLKAMTSYSPFRYPAIDPMAPCVEEGGSDIIIPPPRCRGDVSNRVRLRICQDLWAQDGVAYEGSDKVFTLPLNGSFYGLVEGMNPLNQARVGGTGLYIDIDLAGIDVLQIRYHYNNPADDPDPASREVGHHFLEGRPRTVTRGVMHVGMVNRDDPLIHATAAIFADLDSDEVQF